MVAIAPIPLADQSTGGMLKAAQGYVAPAITAPAVKPISQVSSSPWVAAQNAGTPGYTAAQDAGTPGYVAAQAGWDENLNTVAGRTTRLIDENSPLMQRARTRAAQASNRRGMGNSSIAVGAAENAVLDAAVPIANMDANLYGRNLEVNTGMLNAERSQNALEAGRVAMQNVEAQNTERAQRALAEERVAEQNTANVQQRNQAVAVQDQTAQQFNVQNERDIALTEAELASKAKIINAANQQQADEFTAQQVNAMETEQARIDADTAKFNTQQSNAFIMSQLDQANKVQIADLQSFYENQLAGNQASSDLFQTTMNALDSIQKNVDMDAATKQQNINQQVNMLKSGLTMMSSISGLDLGDALNFSPDTGAPTIAPVSGTQNTINQMDQSTSPIMNILGAGFGNA